MSQGVRAASVLLGALVAGAVTAGPAWAQVPDAPVRTTITTATVFDDNVLSRPTPQADFILRLTPGIALSHTRPRLHWSASYSFDAERYQNRTDLTTAQARQGLILAGAFSESSRTSLSWNGNYTSTTNPTELNPLTGLNIGRVRADQRQAGATVKRAMTPHLELALAYTFMMSTVQSLGSARTNGVDVHFGYRAGPHVETYLRVNAQRFDFGAGTGRPTESTSVNAGWSKHGRLATFTAEAGAQVTQGVVGPRFALTLTRTLGSSTSINAGYTRSVTSAVGIASTVSFDTVQAGLTYRAKAHSPQGGLQISVRTGASRNQILTTDLRSFQYGVDITRPLARDVFLQVGYDGSFQQGIAGAPGLLASDIRRNRVLFTLSLSPWSSR